MGIMSTKIWISHSFLLMVILSVFLEERSCRASDTISPGQSLSGNKTLASEGETFELGFFAPGNSRNYYIGIWYKNLTTEKTVVWVANREKPVSNPVSSELKLLEDGNLVLVNEKGITVWSSDSISNDVNSTTAKLLDNGNFAVIRNYSLILPDLVVIWQSFDYPTDHWLPGMRIGYNEITNDKQCLVSWRNSENPAPSLFSFEFITHDESLNLIWNGTEKYGWFSVYWYSPEGILRFIPELSDYFTYVSNETETYVTYNLTIPNDLTRFMLDVSGQLTHFVWRSGSRVWVPLWTRPELQCSVYGYCGAFSICDEKCVCLEGFEPKEPQHWAMGNHTDGCVRKDAFHNKRQKTTWTIVASIIGLFCTFFAAVLVIIWRRYHSSGLLKVVEEDSLAMFKYHDLRNATKNFSKKLGEGGFGSVFKGTLPDSSTSIAVKKLKDLKQCEKQFLAEVKTIGIIQHINLVRLRGICVRGSKRFLVYEYMPNGSLESHLFGKSDEILNWQSRYRIASGTAKGLAYLHEECRDCIIHCDIKPENILLDDKYNPKVADFGLAKLLGRDFSRVLTTLRGTLGYLAPEWFSGEPITYKADVFSYGMMLLEIISGRRNRDLSENGFQDYFPLRAATAVHNGDNVISLLDQRMEGNAAMEELDRACKVACWCIQDNERDRPSMKEVVMALEGVTEVSIPQIPWFLQRFAERPHEPDVQRDTTSSSSGPLSYV